jgi:hypothetical protein
MTHTPPVLARPVPTALPIALPAPPVVEALPLVSPVVPTVRPVPQPLPVRIVRGLAAGMEWVFGVAVLFVGLAVLAAVPVLQFLSLGYLLEATGRVARSGRLREAFVGVRTAARIGGIVGCSWLLLLPVRFVADMAHSASVIDPGGRTAANWRTGLFVLTAVTFVHIAAAVAMGGKIRHFVSPLNLLWLLVRAIRGGFYAEAREAVWRFVTGLRLPYYFWLGLRGFAAAFIWLLVPITLFALGRYVGAVGPLVSFAGACILAGVLMYLPFLQTRLAAENRFTAGFEIWEVRRLYRNAPIAFAVSLVVTLAFALPLYLLKIEIVPGEAAWLPGLVFIAFIAPARLLTGWAYSRAARRERPRHWFFRWTARLPLLPAAGFYVLVVFFTQYTSWHGVWSLYEQHAFLLPVPFFGG